MPDWRHAAACRDMDVELFFPIGDTGPAQRQTDEAKGVCERCPVIADCLAWALETGQDAGVWGGMSEDERRELKRRAARAATRYGQGVRAAALARYREVRGSCLSDWAAATLVAEEFEIKRVKTVLAWTTVAGGTRRPGRKPDLETRTHAVELFGQLRPHHASERTTYAAVADRLRVHPDTVGVWVREARAAKQATPKPAAKVPAAAAAAAKGK